MACECPKLIESLYLRVLQTGTNRVLWVHSVVVVSIVRIFFLLQIGPDITCRCCPGHPLSPVNSVELTLSANAGDYTGPIIWSSIETSVSVVCACLPIFRPIVLYLWSKFPRACGLSHAIDSEPAGTSDFDLGNSASRPRTDVHFKQFERLEEGSVVDVERDQEI